MSQELYSNHYCKVHQGNHSNYDSSNCDMCKADDKLRRLREKIARLRKEAEAFHMDYRMKCDVETKRLRQELDAARDRARDDGMCDVNEQVQYTIEHRGAFAAVRLAFSLLDNQTDTLQRLIRAAENLESAGICFDPTLLRNYINSDGARTQVDIARLVVKFVREIRSKIESLPKEPQP